MSGIGAIFRRTRGGAPLDDLLGAMASAITDLGGDRTTTVALRTVGFVHTLRSGLTPEDAFDRQPVRARGGALTLVFDGRIDNREELGQLLSIPTSEMSGLADSAVFARAWERFGPVVASRVIGPFAAIVWDDAAAELIAVRDPLGQRTLHWQETPDRFIVASAPRAIHACGVKREVDEVKIADSLLLNYRDDTRTFFLGISRLSRGNRLHVTADRRRVTQYHQVTDVEPLRLASDDDYLDAAGSVLDVAVRACLRTVTPPSLMLSSGLDSTLVAAAAAPVLAERGQTLHAYTSAPVEHWRPAPKSDHPGDESAGVDAFLRMHDDIVHTYVRAPGRGLFDQLDEVLAAADSPPVGGINLHWVHEIHRLTRERGAAVVLTGSAGNLTLGWPGESLVRELAAQRRWREVWGEVRSARGRYGWPVEVYRRLVEPHLPRPIWEGARRLEGRHVRDWRSYSGLDERSPAAATALQRAAALGFDPGFRVQLRRADQISSILDNAMNEGAEIDQAIGALHGTEARDPLFDRRVVEFAFSLPTHQYRRNGVSRWLERRLLDGRAPQEVIGTHAQRGRQATDARLRMAGELTDIRNELAAAADDDMLSRVLDLDRLESIVDRPGWWERPDDVPGEDLDLLALSRAITTARFVRMARNPQLSTAPRVESVRSEDREAGRVELDPRAER